MKTRITLKHIAVIVSLAIALTLIGVKVKGQQSQLPVSINDGTGPLITPYSGFVVDAHSPRLRCLRRQSNGTYKNVKCRGRRIVKRLLGCGESALDGSWSLTYPCAVVSRRKYAHAQQQPAAVIPAPVLYRLNPDASKVFAQIDAAEEKLRQQYAQLENQRTMLLTGAGVPEAARSNCKMDNEQIACSVPLPSPSPK